MKSLLRHLKPKPVSGNRHPASLQRKNITTRNTLLNFHYFLSCFQRKNLLKGDQKYQIINYVICFVLHGIFSMYFVGIFEAVDR